MVIQRIKQRLGITAPAAAEEEDMQARFDDLMRDFEGLEEGEEHRQGVCRGRAREVGIHGLGAGEERSLRRLGSAALCEAAIRSSSTGGRRCRRR